MAIKSHRVVGLWIDYVYQYSLPCGGLDIAENLSQVDSRHVYCYTSPQTQNVSRS